MPPLRILCVGDVHLGRLPVLPPAFLNLGFQPAEFSPLAALRRTVEYALSEQVDAVVFAGDVVDGENRFFESVGPLETSVRKLTGAGIEAYAVAGNHDTDVLPRLAANIDGFTLLGAKGEWQLAPILQGRAFLLGWSFKDKRISDNPMDTLDTISAEIRVTDGPIIGLLHCELDVSGSVYAPVRTADFADTRVSAWLFGHIHKPHALHSMERPVGYLGSLCGLDPTESGAHGPWLLKVEGARLTMEQIPLAPLRWEQHRLDISHCSSNEEVQAAMVGGARGALEEVSAASPDCRAVGLRLSLTGRTPAAGKLEKWLADDPPANQVLTSTSAACFIDKVVTTGVRPARDLEQVALSTDVAGHLARWIMLLQNGAPDAAHTLSGAARSLTDSAKRREFGSLPAAEVDEQAARELLIEEGFALLDDLLDQRPQQADLTVAVVAGRVPHTVEAANEA